MKGALSAVGLGLLGIVVLVVGAGVYLAKDSTIIVATDGDYCGLPANDTRRASGIRICNDMEIRGVWNGLTLAGTGSKSATDLGLTGGDGVVVVQIGPEARTRAIDAGVRVGDVVVAIDQRRVTNLAEARTELQKVDPNAPVLIDVQRETGLATLVVPPEPPPPTSGLQVVAGPPHVCPRDGTLVPAGQVAASGGTCPLCRGPLRPLDPQGVMQ